MTDPGGIGPLFERLLIESHSHCNRSCWFCPRTHDRSGAYRTADGNNVRQSMPTERILSLLDQAAQAGFAGQVAFHGYSEPVLDPRWLDLGEAAADRGLRPYLVTNGDKLRRRQDLCDEAVRVFDRIVVGLYDYESPDQHASEVAFWTDRLEGTEVGFSDIGSEGRGSGVTQVVPKALAPPDERIALPDLVYPNGPCHRPSVRLVIRYDGEVMGCCEDLDGAFGLGNVFDVGLAAAWASRRFTQMRHRLAAGDRSAYALCAMCPQTPTAGRPDGQRIDIQLRSSRPAPADRVEPRG